MPCYSIFLIMVIQFFYFKFVFILANIISGRLDELCRGLDVTTSSQSHMAVNEAKFFYFHIKKDSKIHKFLKH